MDDAFRELLTELRTDIRTLLDGVADIRAHLAVVLSDNKRCELERDELRKHLAEIDLRIARSESKQEGAISMRTLVFTIVATATTAAGSLAALLKALGGLHP